MKEVYISVDVECDGPIPGLYSMTALGASVAGTCTDEGYILNYTKHDPFERVHYVEIAPTSELWNSEAMKVGLFSGFDAEAAKLDPTGEQRRAYIMEHGKPAEEAMTEFVEWVESVSKELDAVPVFAAYPLGFDWMWSYWYMMNFCGRSPFSHGRHVDIKTLYSAKYHSTVTRSTKRYMPKSIRSNIAHTHLAVDDAAEQGELLMHILMTD